MQEMEGRISLSEIHDLLTKQEALTQLLVDTLQESAKRHEQQEGVINDLRRQLGEMEKQQEDILNRLRLREQKCIRTYIPPSGVPRF